MTYFYRIYAYLEFSKYATDIGAEVDLDQAVLDAYEQFVKDAKRVIKDFEKDDFSYDSEKVYISFYSSEDLSTEDIMNRLFNDNNTFVGVSVQEFETGEVVDYDYYEEPYEKTTEEEIDIYFEDPMIDVKELVDDSVTEDCIKKDAGNVEVGTAMFNRAMGEQFGNFKYYVYYELSDNTITYYKGPSFEEACDAAIEAAKHILFDMTQDSKEDRLEAVESILVYDDEQAFDVTPSGVYNKIEALVRKAQQQWSKK